MKKFSKVTNTKVPQKPKVEEKIDESSILKMKMLSLMDRLLKIQSYGPVDNRFLTGSVKIQGKEMLAEALFDLLNQENVDDKVLLLESLKSKVRDWETIDNEIDNLKKRNIKFNNKVKFSKILERYSDEETLLLYLESNVSKIDNKETLEDYRNITLESNISESTKNRILNLLKK